MRMSKYNAEGYSDSTPYEDLKNIQSHKKKHCPTESEEQITLFEWAAINESKYPELKRLHHIPNGGYRNKATAVRLMREGVKRGVPDICLPVSRHGYHGLYIELKRLTGRLTDSQTEWLNDLKKQGYFAVVAYGFAEAKGFIERYLGDKPWVT